MSSRVPKEWPQTSAAIFGVASPHGGGREIGIAGNAAITSPGPCLIGNSLIALAREGLIVRRERGSLE